MYEPPPPLAVRVVVPPSHKRIGPTGLTDGVDG